MPVMSIYRMKRLKIITPYQIKPVRWQYDEVIKQLRRHEKIRDPRGWHLGYSIKPDADLDKFEVCDEVLPD